MFVWEFEVGARRSCFTTPFSLLFPGGFGDKGTVRQKKSLEGEFQTGFYAVFLLLGNPCGRPTLEDARCVFGTTQSREISREIAREMGLH